MKQLVNVGAKHFMHAYITHLIIVLTKKAENFISKHRYKTWRLLLRSKYYNITLHLVFAYSTVFTYTSI